MREIQSHRVSGQHVHQCPKLDERIDYRVCESCEYKDMIEHLKVSYRVYCEYPAHPLAGYEFSKAVDKRNLPKSFDMDKAMREYGIAQTKLDGARAILWIRRESEEDVERNHVVGRRLDSSGDRREWGRNVPHFAWMPLEGLGDTIIDTEIVMPEPIIAYDDAPTGTLGATMSVVGSDPEHAVAVQKKRGHAHFYAFDVVRVKGQDVRNLPYKERWELTKSVVKEMRERRFYNIHLVDTYHINHPDAVKRLREQEIEKGYEGIVLKDENARYLANRAMIKLKEEYTWDVLVTGYRHGKEGSRYEDMVGSVVVSVIDEEAEELREVGAVIPGDDEIREKLTEKLIHASSNRGDIIAQGIVIEVEFQSVTKNFRMRHPRVVRYRDDRSMPETVNFSRLNRK